MSSLTQVFFYALLTAVATGLGALPFLFKKSLSKRRIAQANAVAAALMITASFALIYQGMEYADYG
jgi:NO-binding membrane sensor protein with MHYT domain